MLGGKPHEAGRPWMQSIPTRFHLQARNVMLKRSGDSRGFIAKVRCTRVWTTEHASS